jgi:hypothetical protein
MKREFSKLVLSAAVIVWLAGAVFGGVIVSLEHSQLGELLAYIGAPAATAFGFYYWKAKCENVIKYNKKELDKLKDMPKEGDNDAGI